MTRRSRPIVRANESSTVWRRARRRMLPTRGLRRPGPQLIKPGPQTSGGSCQVRQPEVRRPGALKGTGPTFAGPIAMAATSTRMKNKFTSSVLRNGYIYGLDEAILACLDAETGEQKWKGGRYGYGQILLAGDHLIVLAEDGELALVKATPERYDEVAKFPAIDGKTWNHPVIVNGRLLVRNLREMAAFDIRP